MIGLAAIHFDGDPEARALRERVRAELKETDRVVEITWTLTRRIREELADMERRVDAAQAAHREEADEHRRHG